MKKKKIEENICVPIVGDGAIANCDTAGGRVIPVLVLDCENHKELLNCIYLHEHSPPGDVVCTWGTKAFNSKYAFLLLQFSKPSKIEIALKFDLDTQITLADGIVQSNGVYLQPKESAPRVSEGLDKPKILVEVSPKTKLNNWDEILLKRVVKRMKKKGLSRKQANKAAYDFLDRTREMWGLRMNDA